MSDSIAQMDVTWPSGDCIPALATLLSPDDLARRCGLQTFRKKDDLDWFLGVLLETSEIGPILVMRHENNPERLTAFYVDSSVKVLLAKQVISQRFLLDSSEINWERPIQ